MSSTEKEAPAADKDAAPKKKGGGAVLALVSIILSAGVSGGAAFAAVRFVGQPPAQHVVVEHVAARPPGPTVALEPFLATIPDATGQTHAVKLTVAIELEHDGKVEDSALFLPRIRDTTLGYLRQKKFEDMSGDGIEQMRADLLTRYETVGLVHARKVLVTDLLTQ